MNFYLRLRIIVFQFRYLSVKADQVENDANENGEYHCYHHIDLPIFTEFVCHRHCTAILCKYSKANEKGKNGKEGSFYH
jgi:hypothetical protein